MKIWELRNAALNDVAVLVHAVSAPSAIESFDVNGKPLNWKTRPRASVFVEPRRKMPTPRADISALAPGAFVLNAKAKDAIGDMLTRFGQLLELDVDGHVEWFYNVTHIIDCIDLESSTVRASGTIAREQFFPGHVPNDPVIFKDPRTARTRIYVNEAAKNFLQQSMTSAGITGAEFAEPGPPPPRPRPNN